MTSNEGNKIVINSRAWQHVMCSINILTKGKQVSDAQLKLSNDKSVASSQNGWLLLLIGSERTFLSSLSFYIQFKSTHHTWLDIGRIGSQNNNKTQESPFDWSWRGLCLAAKENLSSDGLFLTIIWPCLRQVVVDYKPKAMRDRNDRVGMA